MFKSTFFYRATPGDCFCPSLIGNTAILQSFKKVLTNEPVDTGRKLNVLCTLNLRHVSTGKFSVRIDNIRQVFLRFGE